MFYIPPTDEKVWDDTKYLYPHLSSELGLSLVKKWRPVWMPSSDVWTGARCKYVSGAWIYQPKKRPDMDILLEVYPRRKRYLRGKYRPTKEQWGQIIEWVSSPDVQELCQAIGMYAHKEDYWERHYRIILDDIWCSVYDKTATNMFISITNALKGNVAAIRYIAEHPDWVAMVIEHLEQLPPRPIPPSPY